VNHINTMEKEISCWFDTKHWRRS